MRNDLIRLREKSNISLRQAAKELKISAAALSKIERGHYQPSFPVADAIASFYNKPVETLFPQFKRTSPYLNYTPKSITRSDETDNNTT